MSYLPLYDETDYRLSCFTVVNLFINENIITVKSYFFSPNFETQLTKLAKLFFDMLHGIHLSQSKDIVSVKIGITCLRNYVENKMLVSGYLHQNVLNSLR